jgi:hypothetical protein
MNNINTMDISSNDDKTRNMLRQLRESLVELFVAIARALFFWMPGGDIEKGKALTACHPIFILCVIGFFFFAPHKSPIRFFIILFTLIVVASQWLLGGCVVTRAEQRLTGSKETILDPFLTLAHLPVTRETRNAATIGASTAICSILIWAYTCDYLHS